MLYLYVWEVSPKFRDFQRCWNIEIIRCYDGGIGVGVSAGAGVERKIISLCCGSSDCIILLPDPPQYNTRAEDVSLIDSIVEVVRQCDMGWKR